MPLKEKKNSSSIDWNDAAPSQGTSWIVGHDQKLRGKEGFNPESQSGPNNNFISGF